MAELLCKLNCYFIANALYTLLRSYDGAKDASRIGLLFCR